MPTSGAWQEGEREAMSQSNRVPSAQGGPGKARSAPKIAPTGGSLSKVIKGDYVRFCNTPTVVRSSTGPAEPQVLLRRRNNVVESIEIVCTCGEHIHVQCEYGEEGIPEVPGPLARNDSR